MSIDEEGYTVPTVTDAQLALVHRDLRLLLVRSEPGSFKGRRAMIADEVLGALSRHGLEVQVKKGGTNG